MILQEIPDTSLLELVAGFGYLGGHFLLSRKCASGWIAKIVGGIAWIIFLLQNNNYIFGTVTIVVVTTMLYGLYKWHTNKFDKHTKIDTFFEILATIVAILMILRFIFFGIYQLSAIFETVIVIMEILGTVLLAHQKMAGWYLYILMSLFVSALVIFINPNPAIILGILEALSIYFYYKGIRNFSKNISSNNKSVPPLCLLSQIWWR